MFDYCDKNLSPKKEKKLLVKLKLVYNLKYCQNIIIHPFCYQGDRGSLSLGTSELPSESNSGVI